MIGKHPDNPFTKDTPKAAESAGRYDYRQGIHNPTAYGEHAEHYNQGHKKESQLWAEEMDIGPPSGALPSDLRLHWKAGHGPYMGRGDSRDVHPLHGRWGMDPGHI
jgi:hypothetical protein